MTGFRPPIVAGVSGGVGTTTLALALHATDAGTMTADADVLVCRSSAESLDRATRIADLAGPGRYPVLVVTLAGTERRPPPRVTELGGRWATVIAAPHVPRWSTLVDPYREAAGLLGSPREQLPRALRGYLDAVARAARIVADSGRLTAPAPQLDGPLEPIHRPFVPVPPIPTTSPFDRRAVATVPPPAARPGLGAPAPHEPPPILAAGPSPYTAVRPLTDGDPDPGPPLAPAPRPTPADPGPGGTPFLATPTTVASGRFAAAPGTRGDELSTVLSTTLSTVDSTGCGEDSVLPELRPVRGIRVLAIGGVT